MSVRTDRSSGRPPAVASTALPPGRVDAAAALVGVVTALVILVAPVDALPTAVSTLVLVGVVAVPGLALMTTTGWQGSLLGWSLALPAGAGLLTALAVTMLWTGSWAPRAAAVVSLLVSAAVCARAAARQGGRIGVRTPPEPPVSVRPRAAGARLLPAGLLLLALLAWVRALVGTDVDAMTTTGLLGVLPVTFYVAVLLALAVCLWGVQSGRQLWFRSGGGLLLLLLLLYATSPLLQDAPRLPWVFKHVGVTEYILANGSLDPDLDLYHRWPGFFALTALLSGASGSDPLTMAAWSELAFAVVDGLLVLCIARGVMKDDRYAWTVALLFTLANWVGQNYFAPQALGFTLYLAIWAVLVRLPRSRVRTVVMPVVRWTSKVLRVGASRVDEPGERLSGRALPAVLGLFAVVVVSHQLSPYLIVLTMVPAVVSGLLRPAWLPVACLGLAVAFLVPNLAFVQERWGVVTGFDPVQNATYAPVSTGIVPEAVVLQGRGVLLLTACLAGLALLGAVRRARTGQVTDALFALSTAAAPGLVLLGQSYGGEGRLRVILFALPWLCLSAAWAFVPERTAPRRLMSAFSTVVMAGSAAVLAALSFLTSLQPETDVRVRGSEVVASNALYELVEPGDFLLLTAPQFPTYQSANYYVPRARDLSGRQAEWPDYDPYSSLDMETLEIVMRSFVPPGERARGFVIFSPSQEWRASSRELYEPGRLERFREELRASPDVVQVYDDGGVEMYRVDVAPRPPDG